MNSPLSNHFLYYNHNLHDPTLVNVHTLLNPQPFKHHIPPSISTFQSATTQYWASHPPFPHQLPITTTTTNLFNHDLYQHYPYSSPSFTSSLTSNLQPHNLTKQQPTQPLNSTNTDFLLQQILLSQQALNHAISNFAFDLSTLNTSLPPSINTYNITKTQQQSAHATTSLHDHVPERHTSPPSQPILSLPKEIATTSPPSVLSVILLSQMNSLNLRLSTKQKHHMNSWLLKMILPTPSI